ncbi:MAG: hypothetical protein ABIT38_13470, partial [Gemmatimonadaceae bacterium]
MPIVRPAMLGVCAALAVLATLTAGCATLNGPTSSEPAVGDSLLAKRQLTETLDDYWRETLPKHPAIALANGFFVNAYRDLSFEAARKTTRFSQGIVRQ